MPTALEQISFANTPLYLRPGIEWEGPFTIVEEIDSTEKIVSIRLDHPSYAYCNFAETIGIRSSELEFIERISLRLQDKTAASISGSALRQIGLLLTPASKAINPPPPDWLELPFFARHALYHGRETCYSLSELVVEFADGQPRKFEVIRRYRTIEPCLALATSWVHRHLDSLVSQGVRRLPRIVDRIYDSDADPGNILLEYSLRDFVSAESRFNSLAQFEILLDEPIFPVRIWVTAYDKQDKWCDFKAQALLLDGKEVETNFQLSLAGTFQTILPLLSADKITLVVTGDQEISKLSLVIEHDRYVACLAGMQALVLLK